MKSSTPLNMRAYPSVASRRQAVEKALGVSLPHLSRYSLDEEVAASRHCENMIGAVQIPLGIAGPLRLMHLAAGTKRHDHPYYIPLATTEGALVASVSRGCKAITESGGATVDSYRRGATRSPVFRVETLQDSDRLNRFLLDSRQRLIDLAGETSRHLRLVDFTTRGVGKYRFVRFVFDTADAMGMNMVTIASDALARYIAAETGCRCVALAGNYDTDKKPSWLNVIENRGFKVWADVVIPSAVLTRVLKTSAARLYETWIAKCMIGSAMAGSMGFNAQYANILSAIFIATGQDPAHVAECSVGITTLEISGRGLSAAVYLPDLMVGTVGGGTGLATQAEALAILGVAGGQEGVNAERFAEIIAGAVLAGELSLLASLSEGSLAAAHQRLARGRPAGTEGRMRA